MKIVLLYGSRILLHSLERAGGSIGHHVNADKTEYMCFNQTGGISSLKGGLLKLVDKFTNLGSSVLSTDTDITGDYQSHGKLSIGYR